MITCPKCSQEHEPSGHHEDDSGEFECESCGFMFFVIIDYDPVYTEVCVEHEWGKWGTWSAQHPDTVCRFCQYCGKCDIQ